MEYLTMHPYTFFAVAAVIAGLLYTVKSAKAQFALLASYVALLGGFTWHEFLASRVIETPYMYADELSVVLMAALTVLGAASALQGYFYSRNGGDTPKRIARHNAALVAFLTVLVGIFISQHLGLIWAFLEASTLLAAILIYHNRTRSSTEATWKYVFICSIGIAIAFAGILFLGIAYDHHDLSLATLHDHAHVLNSSWVKMSILFQLVGASVKMGVVPLFSADIDAKDAAPSHISALLSGAMMCAGFTAIFRVYSVYANTELRPWLNGLFLLTGALSILIAAIYILKVRNFKRLLAYSCCEHAGIVLVAIGCGAWYAAVLHLLLHAFAKTALYFQYNHYFRIFKTKDIHAGGRYMSIHPAGSGVLILGMLALCGLPPMGTFITELITIRTLLATPWWGWAIPVLFLFVVIIWALTSHINGVLFSTDNGEEKYQKHVPRTMALETLPQYALLGIVIWLGFFAPQSIVAYIQRASVIYPLH